MTAAVSTGLRRTLAGALLAAVALAVPGRAAAVAAVAPSEALQASVRALGFLEGRPQDGRLVLGVVYDADSAQAREQARETVAAFSQLRGPQATSLQPVAIAAQELAAFDGRLDAVYLMPGSMAQSSSVNPALRNRRIVSISSDPACLAASCCVLMVSAQRRVEIVLDTALMESLGLRFSTVFTLMVKRK